jgi:microcompartment protein CcmL/EutN
MTRWITIGLLETAGLTPAMVALEAMIKAARVEVLQVELNDLCGVVIKIHGATAEVHTAIAAGRCAADQMRGQPVATILNRVAENAVPAIDSPEEFSPLIQQPVVFRGSESSFNESANQSPALPMNQSPPPALGFIETQGFTAVFEAIDTACKAASVEVAGKEKLGGGFVTVIIQGELSAVSAAIAAGKEKVEGLGKLIAAHVIARPSEAVLKLLPKL